MTDESADTDEERMVVERAPDGLTLIQSYQLFLERVSLGVPGF